MAGQRRSPGLAPAESPVLSSFSLGPSTALFVSSQGSGLPSQVALRVRPISVAELEEGATLIAHKVDEQVRGAVAGNCRPGHRSVPTSWGQVPALLVETGRAPVPCCTVLPLPTELLANTELATSSRKQASFSRKPS